MITAKHSNKRLARWAPTLVLMGLLMAPLMAQVNMGGMPSDGTAGPPAALADGKDLGEEGEVIIDFLNVQDEELKTVLRGIGLVSGLNIVMGQDISGRVSLFVRKVKVKNVLETVLRINKYGYLKRDNIVMILPASVLGEADEIRITEVIQMQHLDVSTLKTDLEQITGEGGDIAVNEQSNSLIVKDTPEGIKHLRRIIEEMDQPRMQVSVEAHLVEITLGDDFDLGIDWNFTKSVDPDDTLTANSGSNLGRALTVPANRVLSGGIFDFGYTRGFGTVTGFLSALESKTNVKVLANPNIVILDNHVGTIEIQDQIPFVETNISQGVITESITFQETGIKLVVTPQITRDKVVHLHTMVEQRIAGPRITLSNSSAFDVQHRRAENDLILKSGQTMAIGGLINTSIARTYDRVPVLGHIPIVGALFTKKAFQESRTEMIMFITPNVYDTLSHHLSPRQEDALSEFAPALEDIDYQKKETFEKDSVKREQRREQEQQKRLKEIEKQEQEILKADEEARKQAERRADDQMREAEKMRKQAEKEEMARVKAEEARMKKEEKAHRKAERERMKREKKMQEQRGKE
jgi:type IV pilus secretin PilQ/predicted competence protein